jgi:hypothetical protein
VRGSLVKLDESDGKLLENTLIGIAGSSETFSYDDQAFNSQPQHRISTLQGEVVVSIPPEPAPEEFTTPVGVEREVRESIKIQSLLVKIARAMGLNVWVPRNDRAAIITESGLDDAAILNTLPLNYNEITIKTIEQIDVLWLKRRSIIRAFEVEHTTSIYSGILRMADLMALQPNMNIDLHIVAPIERRDKVFQEITRPVFSLLEDQPLSKICSFISYDSVKELAAQPNLSYVVHNVLDEYAEYADDE